MSETTRRMGRPSRYPELRRAWIDTETERRLVLLRRAMRVRAPEMLRRVIAAGLYTLEQEYGPPEQ